MRILIALLLALPALGAGNLCLGPTGSTSATWSGAAWINCGGTVPGDGDFAVWRSTGKLTFDQDIGTIPGGGVKTIRIENGTFDATPGITITFASTCMGVAGCASAAIAGSGTATNPGADATMHGLFIARTSGASSLAGTAAARITIKTADPASRFYIHHGWGDVVGCTAYADNVCNGSAVYVSTKDMTFGYVDFHGLGADVAEYRGISLAVSGTPVTALTTTYSRFYSPVGLMVSSGSATTVTFNSNTVYDPLYQYGLSSVSNPAVVYRVADNTVFVGTVSGAFVYSLYRSIDMVLARNAVLNSATNHWYIYNGSARGGTLRQNYWESPAALSAAVCYFGQPTNDRNICRGSRAIGLYAADGFPSAQTGNWTSQWKTQTAGQGNYITYGTATSGTAEYTFTGEVMVVEDADAGAGPMGILCYTPGTNNNSIAQISHITMALPSLAWGGIYFGEPISGTIGGMREGIIRSSIVTGGAAGLQYQIGDGHILNAWNAAAMYNGSGVHHNLTYGAQGDRYYSARKSVGFDDGANGHPNALYGDIVADPRYLDTSRRPCQYGAKIGGDGTCPDLFARLATRALDAPGCTVCQGYGEGGIIEAIRQWLFAGWGPTNLAIMGKAHDGTDIGAVPITVYNTPGGVVF